MKRIVLIVLAVFVALPLFAQVGRFKNIKTWYPGYSLKFDTATGELFAIHYDNEADMLLKIVRILKALIFLGLVQKIQNL